MLYKKYHRNFVKQFKRGVNFIAGCGSIGNKKFRVTREPHLPDSSSSRIYVEDGKLYTWTLVYPTNGKINKYLHVIQEIS